MKKLFTILILFCQISMHALDRPMKVLHLTFHEGCKNDFQEVADELGLDTTTWFVQQLPKKFWNGKDIGNAIYNINPERAQEVWDLHKEFFDTFDAIVTSDTVPLARIFLQNNWCKPLIIWICNRFDYYDLPTFDGSFPDREYYHLMRDATKRDNVFFAAYTPYEAYYCKRKAVMVPNRVIKPLGKQEQEIPTRSFIKSGIQKENTLFLFPRLADLHSQKVLKECQQRDLACYTGTYNGPDDLKQFKGVLFFPYAFSNLALFENLQRGIVHFVPTMSFLQKLGFMRRDMAGKLKWSEWYFKEYAEYIQYFNSWDELKLKVAQTNYPVMRRKIKAFGQQHRQEMLLRWRSVFRKAAKIVG